VTVAAVVFDWGGTLTPWHTIELADAWRAVGLDEDAAGRLVAAEQTVWARARDTQRSGTMDEVFAAAGVTAGPQELAAYYAWWEEHSYTDPDVRPLWQALRALPPRQEGRCTMSPIVLELSGIHVTSPHSRGVRLAALGRRPGAWPRGPRSDSRRSA